MTVRAAVIGCGDISSVHLAAIGTAPGAELVAVCDTDPGRLAAAAERHAVPGFPEAVRMLDSVRPDVVHVCTPHSTHAALAVAALDRGVAVLLEKPLASSVAEGEQVIAAAERGGARIGVCFQNRYNPPVQRLRELLASGSLGAVTGAAATVLWHRAPGYYLDRPWRGMRAEGGGGMLMNQAIHTVDLLQWLLGEVVAVSGSASTRLLPIEVEDTADLVLTHASGARSVLYATVANAWDEPVELRLRTERATVSLRGALTVRRDDGSVEVVPDTERRSGGRSYWGASHELLVHDFYARLGEDEPFWISPREAARSLAIVQAAYAPSAPARIPHSTPNEGLLP
ncbi:gfo/Idh/MocA family oxidoreductase [Rathayibacter sp. AY1E9]|jgi:predicted dehydrogenase|uniref:Gfo/Idh/MocA family protein n=1 Tax=unclassified Rathayibacter TaxID=2609250 RepID=UPI000CE754C7|nr:MULTISPECIES: Gfo/Idh/MocA family oxidoreductase [unclassified Rathayibacter]PPG52409.1 gfo/Idh/MocA family oxidoreductase [Rathayibacter sp. AY1E9]PPH24248.1 gfo/Idh/MocA family oxidoreductase [Rathayibacter sp. AY1C4]PPH41746.1 gfo/Idh/MocA family oxidoreductase [Rathayibacter sp. AY1E4]PPH47403.1 gfo/Idh/MocA family oxidoreductase [Rathayibacter sp. AY1C9]PPI01301.1 gfo/Idh/MocA family oxidoreductase [Rathayibacter sp. AY1B7]